MRIAICEDETIIASLIQDKISSILNQIDKDFSIHIYNRGYDLLDSQIQKYDLILLDIYLPDINGYEVAKKIREYDDCVNIVILTSASDYVFDCYKVKAFRYLLKKNFDKEIEDIIISIYKNLKNQKDYIIVNNKNGFIKVMCEDIMYIESHLRKLIIYEVNKNISIYGKLSDFEEKLLDCNFLRPHQSYLVNTKYIKLLNAQHIILDNNTAIPISKARMNYTKKKVMEFFR